MGAWGVEPFENDKALDWVYELKKTDDESELRRAIETVVNLSSDEYMDLRYCCEAIAAAEVITALKGSPPQWLTTEVGAWVAAHPSVNYAPLIPIALQALERIRTDSEAKELWADSKHNEEWLRSTNDLEARLRQ